MRTTLFQKGLASSGQETKDFALEIRTPVSDEGVFEGYASIFGGPPDSYGDIIAKGAFHQTLVEGGRNGNGVVMLWHHIPSLPIGVWESMLEDEKGLPVRGRVNKDATPEGIPVYSSLKMGAVKGLSIGFRTIKADVDENTGIRTIKDLELFEVSLVTFPAVKRATVTTVKEIESARTPRELERSLREAGLSHQAAKYMVSLCRLNLGKRDAAFDEASADKSLLTELKRMRVSLEFFKTTNF